MSGHDQQGTFDKLNDALFAQLERLSNAGEDTVESEIKRSNAVSQLAVNINNNMANAVKVANILAMEGADIGGMSATLPGMLAPAQLHEPNWEVVDPFIAGNAEKHTVSYIVDKLRKQGVSVSHDAVRRRCEEIGVEPKRLDEPYDMVQAERERYAQRKLASDGNRR